VIGVYEGSPISVIIYDIFGRIGMNFFVDRIELVGEQFLILLHVAEDELQSIGQALKVSFIEVGLVANTGIPLAFVFDETQVLRGKRVFFVGKGSYA
jgi:hypothetical protein